MSRYKFLLKEALSGKSLFRSLHNFYLKGKKLEGRGIDFGAKTASSSYYRVMSIDKASMTFTDFYSENSDEIKSINFEEEFDLSDEQYDFALAMNVLEHIYNYNSFLKNVHKSLKQGGVLEGFVPFLYHYHADPDDYFRYSHTALRRMLEEAEFTDIKIVKIGVGGFSTSANMISRIVKLKLLVFVWWVIAINMDKLVSIFWAKNKNIYSGLAFTAKKGSR